MSMDIQKHPRESQETLPDSFLQNHNLVSSFTCRPWFNSNSQQFYFKLEWLELAAGAPLDSCMLQAIREDCLNHKPFSISASFFLSFLLEFLLFLALTPNLLFGSQSLTIFHFVFNHSQPTFTYRGIA